MKNGQRRVVITGVGASHGTSTEALNKLPAAVMGEIKRFLIDKRP